MKKQRLAREVLAALGSCGDETEWVGDRTPEQAWLDCPRGDWLLKEKKA